MFARLFSRSGLSLDRLRALVEVGASGSIVKAAGTDLARQSQFSRQIKELEDFFSCKLVERHGKGIRLTSGGRELARISRFFLLGLSNFQLGCNAEDQTYRIGAPPTFSSQFLLPCLSSPAQFNPGLRFSVEQVPEDEIEQRLHDLRLDFGIVTRSELSRPLQTKALMDWNLEFFVPRKCARSSGGEQFRRGTIPFAWPAGELPRHLLQEEIPKPALSCESFLETIVGLRGGRLAAFAPDFLLQNPKTMNAIRLDWPFKWPRACAYHLAWNPRLLRLNAHAARRRDALVKGLSSLFPPAPDLTSKPKPKPKL